MINKLFILTGDKVYLRRFVGLVCFVSALYLSCLSLIYSGDGILPHVFGSSQHGDKEKSVYHCSAFGRNFLLFLSKYLSREKKIEPLGTSPASTFVADCNSASSKKQPRVHLQALLSASLSSGVLNGTLHGPLSSNVRIGSSLPQLV